MAHDERETLHGLREQIIANGKQIWQRGETKDWEVVVLRTSEDGKIVNYQAMLLYTWLGRTAKARGVPSRSVRGAQESLLEVVMDVAGENSELIQLMKDCDYYYNS